MALENNGTVVGVRNSLVIGCTGVLVSTTSGVGFKNASKDNGGHFMNKIQDVEQGIGFNSI